MVSLFNLDSAEQERTLNKNNDRYSYPIELMLSDDEEEVEEATCE